MVLVGPPIRPRALIGFRNYLNRVAIVETLHVILTEFKMQWKKRLYICAALPAIEGNPGYSEVIG